MVSLTLGVVHILSLQSGNEDVSWQVEFHGTQTGIAVMEIGGAQHPAVGGGIASPSFAFSQIDNEEVECDACAFCDFLVSLMDEQEGWDVAFEQGSCDDVYDYYLTLPDLDILHPPDDSTEFDPFYDSDPENRRHLSIHINPSQWAGVQRDSVWWKDEVCTLPVQVAKTYTNHRDPNQCLCWTFLQNNDGGWGYGRKISQVAYAYQGTVGARVYEWVCDPDECFWSLGINGYASEGSYVAMWLTVGARPYVGYLAGTVFNPNSNSNVFHWFATMSGYDDPGKGSRTCPNHNF